MKNLEKYSPYVLALLRIIAAYMFILHGTAKFWEFPISMTGGNGAVGDPMMIVGGVIEIVGSILLILGLFVRPAAFYSFRSNGLCVFLYARCRSREFILPNRERW